VCLALALAGCGAITLLHDKYLGPMSPAGFINPIVTGTKMRVTTTGVEAAVAGKALLEPVPPDLIERLGAVHTLRQGLQYAVSSFSFVVSRSREVGRALGPEQLARLRVGMSVQEVLAALGAPLKWIKRRHGSFMLYKSERTSLLSIFVGLPPGAAYFIPVPGVGNLTFRYTTGGTTPRKALLLFDGDGVLRFVSPVR
jgi:hypothetical protein